MSEASLDLLSLAQVRQYCRDLLTEHEAIVAQLQAQNASLQEQMEELRRRINQNSKNSSRPPSSDGPQVSKRSSSRGTGRLRGAQKGHEPHFCKPIAPEEADKIVDCKPTHCQHCGQILEGEDHHPTYYPQFDIPPLRSAITLHAVHSILCPACHKRTRPAKTPNRWGSRLQALIALLSGKYHLSRRNVKQFLNQCFQIPISVGGISHCERQITQALSKPVEEMKNLLHKQNVLHVDETGFRIKNGKRGWLWTAVSPLVGSAFSICTSRGKASAQSFLGNYDGVLVSDRWTAYNGHPGLRQLCWAHLARDFASISEHPGEYGKLGEGLCATTKEIFTVWRLFKFGSISRNALRTQIQPLRAKIHVLLVSGERNCPPYARKLRLLLKAEHFFWTFVEVDGVEPTNNLAERTIRPAVLWRLISFGVQSERGQRFVESMLSVTETCKQQTRNVFEYMLGVMHAWQQGLSPPLLVLSP
jgi:transposase